MLSLQISAKDRMGLVAEIATVLSTIKIPVHQMEARSFGDLSENSEYDEAKNEQAKLYGRIAEVENILTHAVLIDENTDADVADRVGLGCTVKVRDIEFDEIDVFAIVGSQEANPMEKRISDDSPFGRAMLGKHIGDIVEVDAPVGVVKFEILDVNR